MISKNTVITALVILSLVLGFFAYNGIKVSSDRESALERELQYSNQRILEMIDSLDYNSILIDSLEMLIDKRDDTIKKQKEDIASIEDEYNKSKNNVFTISNDSSARYLTYRINRLDTNNSYKDPKIVLIDKDTVLQMDIGISKLLNYSLLSLDESLKKNIKYSELILLQDKQIEDLKTTNSLYQNSIILKDSIMLEKDNMISLYKNDITKKENEITKYKKQRRLLAILAGALGLIAIIK